MNGATISILPIDEGQCDTRINARSALYLAVLGAAAGRMVPLDRLLNMVWCLGSWRPPREVVFETLRLATRNGHVSATESWVRSVPFLYSLTGPGAETLLCLMRSPLPTANDPATTAAASVKHGLLDLLDATDRSKVAADLRRYYLMCREDSENRRELLPAHRALIQHMASERTAWLESRLKTLDMCPGQTA